MKLAEFKCRRKLSFINNYYMYRDNALCEPKLRQLFDLGIRNTPKVIFVSLYDRSVKDGVKIDHITKETIRIDNKRVYMHKNVCSLLKKRFPNQTLYAQIHYEV